MRDILFFRATYTPTHRDKIYPGTKSPISHSAHKPRANDDKNEVQQIGHRILDQAMTKLSEKFIDQKDLDDKHTFWRTWVIGGTSFGAKTFGHKLYKRDESTDNNYYDTPPDTNVLSFDNFIIKLFWLDCPEIAFNSNPRNLQKSWDNEVKILTDIQRKSQSDSNPCVNIDGSGVIEIEYDFSDIPVLRRLNNQTKVGWIKMERLNPVEGKPEGLTSTIQKLHNLGYTHNDLHSGNIMRRGWNDIVLIDLEKATLATYDGKITDLKNAAKLENKEEGTLLDEVDIGSPTENWSPLKQAPETEFATLPITNTFTTPPKQMPITPTAPRRPTTPPAPRRPTTPPRPTTPRTPRPTTPRTPRPTTPTPPNTPSTPS